MSTNTVSQILQQRSEHANRGQQIVGGRGANVNVTKVTLVTNVNVIPVITNRSVEEVRRIADRLVESFNAPSDHAYFCKLAWRLPEAAIWTAVEAAKTGRQPLRLFTWLTSRELAKTPGQGDN